MTESGELNAWISDRGLIGVESPQWEDQLNDQNLSPILTGRQLQGRLQSILKQFRANITVSRRFRRCLERLCRDCPSVIVLEIRCCYEPRSAGIVTVSLGWFS